MTLGQSQKGATVNASISVLGGSGPNAGEYVYTFNDPTIDMTIDLTNSSGVIVEFPCTN